MQLLPCDVPHLLHTCHLYDGPAAAVVPHLIMRRMEGIMSEEDYGDAAYVAGPRVVETPLLLSVATNPRPKH